MLAAVYMTAIRRRALGRKLAGNFRQSKPGAQGFENLSTRIFMVCGDNKTAGPPGDIFLSEQLADSLR